MSRYRKHLLSAVCVFFSVISEVRLVHAQAEPSIVPLSPGLTIVLAVHAPNPAAAGSRIAQGDYEMVVTVANVSPSGIDESTRIEAVDENRGFGERRPVEPNETIAGRARNRRVELVRDCSGNR